MTWVSGVLAVFFNVFINPIALQAIGWRYYIVFVATLVCYGVTAYFFYPETKYVFRLLCMTGLNVLTCCQGIFSRADGCHL